MPRETSPPRLTRPITGVRNAYASHEAGATGYYADEGARYVNPHDGGVREMLARATRDWPELWGMEAPGNIDDKSNDDEFGDRILDLSCGSGEVTSALVAAGVPLSRIDACDPYTHEAYLARVGKKCERWSFEDVARGAIAERRWSVVVCSFAMHLCARGYLPTLCMMLACSARHLVVLTPHKRPVIDAAWGGWRLAAKEARDPYWRIRSRWYSTGPRVDDDVWDGEGDDDDDDDDDDDGEGT